MLTLGIWAFGRDSSAVLLDETSIIAAIEEEKLSRASGTGGIPRLAVARCLEQANAKIENVQIVGFPFRPGISAVREAGFRFHRSFSGAGPSAWMQSLGQTFRQAAQIRQIRGLYDGSGSFLFLDHHLCHAASAYYLAGFEEAAILSIDGAGEDITTWFGRGMGHRIVRRHCVRLPHSLGLLYSAVTDYLGFKPWGGEGKVMGLAPYGDPARYRSAMHGLLHWNEDGRFELDLRYFDFHVTGWTRWISPAFEQVFGPRRPPQSELTSRHQDVAAALQEVVEDAALALVRHLHRLVPSRNLCLAGGVALNSVMNGRIRREGPFEHMFVQPAANDAGTALGGALLIAHGLLGLPRVESPEVVYLGPEYSAADHEAAARDPGLIIERPDDTVERTAELLAAGKIVGWFQGRMEVGPRALGNRSILADPRDATMKDTLNHRVKHREAFRPFAPSVLEEHAAEWFEGVASSPHMLLVFPVNPARRGRVPAVTHVDGTARVQTVSARSNPRFHRLIAAFGRRTGVPMLLNTSFNVQGEPIVCTPSNAVHCFKGTDMDYLVLGDLVLRKP